MMMYMLVNRDSVYDRDFRADGVVLGADTRATEDTIVADKNCEKIHYIAPNIYCCGAGTAADTEATTQLISSQIELHALNTGRKPRVATANRMLKQMLFRYQVWRAGRGGGGVGVGGRRGGIVVFRVDM